MKNFTIIAYFFMAILSLRITTVNNYAQTSNWTWAESAGTNRYDKGNSIAKDAAGNIYVAGVFSDSSISFGTTVLKNAGYTDMVIVKYNPNGKVLWAKSVGGAGVESGESITVDANGNVFVTGAFSGSSIIIGNTVLTNADYGEWSALSDMYIVKYDSEGNVIWAKAAGGKGNIDGGNGIVTDKNGNVYVTGEFWSSIIQFGAITLENIDTAVSNIGSADIFIAKYDPNGNILWAKSGGGSNNDRVHNIAIDGSGNICIVGEFRSSSMSFGITTLKNPNFDDFTSDIFIMKFDSSGNAIWARAAGGSDSDRGKSISTDASGNLYVTGEFSSTSISFEAITLYSTGKASKMFIVKYNPDGDASWAQSSDQGIGESVTVDDSGNIYLSGSFFPYTITFDTITLYNNANTGTDIFVVKYNPKGDVLWAKAAGGDGNEICKDIVESHGNIYITGYFTGYTSNFDMITLLNHAIGSEDFFVAKLHSSPTSVSETDNENLIEVTASYISNVISYFNLFE